MTRIPPEQRFWNLVDKSGDCWTWKTGKLGRFWTGERIVESPRWSWESVNGTIPEGLLIRHKCDNPPCVRPDHLEPGTHADNSADMVNRRRSLRGERHNMAKLDEVKVRDIKNRLQSGERQADLHREYGVSRMAISDIALGKRWGWVI